jgi:Cu+-exporting ATPase
MVADQAPAKPIPADAVWTELQVAGIRCGGCARRIKGALVDQMGVLGVEVDVATAKVRIATVAGIDGRGLAKPVIDRLGYRVQ